MASLLITTEGGERSRYQLEGKSVRIGRSGRNDIVLQDLSVSRTHVDIVRCPRGYCVHDLGGKNGTYLNELRIAKPTMLRPGDTIRIGKTHVFFDDSPFDQVEFVDSPLPKGQATTLLPVGPIPKTGTSVVTPPLVGERERPQDRLLDTRADRAEMIPTPATHHPMPPEIPSIVIEADKELVFHHDIEEILEKLMDLAHRVVPFERGYLKPRIDEERLRPVIRVPSDGTVGKMPISKGIVDHVLHHREAVLTSDALRDHRFSQRDSVAAEHIRAAMCVPLCEDEKVVGYLYVDSRKDPDLFTLESLRVLTHLANVASVKIENNRLFNRELDAQAYERELAAAARIWRRHLPSKTPTVPGYSFYGTSVPCREVGGDCYDFMELPDGRYGLGLGDVAGHGLPAAMLMCSFSSSLRALSTINFSQTELMERLNQIMYHQCESNRYVAFFYGVLDPAQNTLTYMNTGLVFPFLVRPGSEVDRLTEMGLPVGMFDKVKHPAGRIEFRPDDILLICSDGLTEATSVTGELFGEERVASLVTEHAGAEPFEIARILIDEIENHLGDTDHQDDITLVVLKRIL